MTQLGLDGRATPYPLRRPRPLSDRQREVLRFMQTNGDVRPVQIGMLMHAGRSTTRLHLDRYASSDGSDALRRLAKRGLVERVHRGVWRVIEHEEDW